jgi:hypothetical protein
METHSRIIVKSSDFKIAVSKEEEMILINSHQEHLPRTDVRVIEIDAYDFIVSVVLNIWGKELAAQVEDVLAMSEPDFFD